MPSGNRLHLKVLNPGDAFKFDNCVIREFAIGPTNGREDFSYDLKVYNQTVRMENVALEDGGLNNHIMSCPETPNGYIEITCITGQLVVFHKN